MNAFVKRYPRARVSRHPLVNGWVIDLIQRNGAKPSRVGATYVTAEFAVRAALVKLGVQPSAPLPPLPPRTTPAVRQLATPTQPPGANHRSFRKWLPEVHPGNTCIPCGRPMRPTGTKASEHPNTVLRQREGLCQSCCQRAKREGMAA